MPFRLQLRRVRSKFPQVVFMAYRVELKLSLRTGIRECQARCVLADLFHGVGTKYGPVLAARKDQMDRLMLMQSLKGFTVGVRGISLLGGTDNGLEKWPADVTLQGNVTVWETAVMILTPPWPSESSSSIRAANCTACRFTGTPSWLTKHAGSVGCFSGAVGGMGWKGSLLKKAIPGKLTSDASRHPELGLKSEIRPRKASDAGGQWSLKFILLA